MAVAAGAVTFSIPGAGDALARVPMDEWLVLLMHVLIVEYNVAVLELRACAAAAALRERLHTFRTQAVRKNYKGLPPCDSLNRTYLGLVQRPHESF